jgi:hypothetical protein
MIVQLPEKIPLEMPPGDVDAMQDLARRVGSAARCLVSVDVRISGPEVDAPGWLGDDASAAAGQVIRIATLVRAAHDAVATAAQGLATHAERLLETRSRVRTLVHEQDEHFQHAVGRWYRIPDLQAQLMIGGPEVRAIVADLEAGEASRRRRHNALLEEIEDDASATSRVLVDCCAAVGGLGRWGDANRVVAYLAAELPGWGDRELMRRGRALAGRLTGGTPEEKSEAAAGAAAFGDSPAFAGALLAALGSVGVRYVLTDLGRGDTYAKDSPGARVLAAAFGAAVPGSEADNDPVARVLGAEYVRPEDDFATTRNVATGLAMVLAAGNSAPSDAVGTPTAAAWGRQFLLWERENHEPIGTRSPIRAPEVGDPSGLAISILAARGDPRVSAAFLDDTTVWQAALSRPYDDGGAALGQVIAHAGEEPGTRGDRVLRMGLATAGAGLAGDDPYAWTVNRHTLAGASRGLGEAVSQHIDVAVEALKVGVDVHRMRSQADVLAGLGYVTLDREAAARVEQALSAWAQVRPEALVGTDRGAALPGAAVLGAAVLGAAVLGAYVAVQEFAQRTNHAMDALEDQAEALAKQALETYTWGLIPTVLQNRAGMVLGTLETIKAMALHLDGTWIDRPDNGLVFGRTDAAALARTVIPTEGTGGERAVLRQARAAYRRTAAVMPVREAAMSPTPDLGSLGLGAAVDLAAELIERNHGGHVPGIRLSR